MLQNEQFYFGCSYVFKVSNFVEHLSTVKQMSNTKPCMIYIFSPWFADIDFPSRWVFNVGNFRHSRYAYLQVLFSSKKQLEMNQQRSEFFKFTNEFLLKSTDVGYSLDHVRKTV